MLELRHIHAGYRDLAVLFDVSLKVERGEIVALIGSNGAGKSTVVNVVTGLLRPNEGEVIFLGERIDRCLPHQIVKLGISHIPEGRQIFYHMSVLENLKMGTFIHKDIKTKQKQIEWVFSLFPILRERRSQRGEH